MDIYKHMSRLGMLLIALICAMNMVQAQSEKPVSTQKRNGAAIAEKRITQADREAAAKRLAKKRAALKNTVNAANKVKAAMDMPRPDPGVTPHYFTMPNWAFSPPLKKFVDTLPGIDKANNLGNYIPKAIPDTTTYPGSDYYEIELVQFTQKMHSDLAPTTLRGYRQTNGPDTKPHYLGPIIVAQRDRPVRIKFTNALPTGQGGNLFIPVDKTVMGAGMGPLDAIGPDGMPTGMKEEYTQNRATLHLHGGRTPWISDGTPHQWITPANEKTQYPKGVSVRNVPDMPDPGPGSMTFFYTNQQSARLMFYHDHSYGITRLNVYAGEAAGYMIEDKTEKELVDGGFIPAEQIPLIIQDKTFIDADEASPTYVYKTDPTWNWGSMPGMAMSGDLWMPHVYMTAQNPYDISGTNPFGRWHYGPWFWPPTKDVVNGPKPNPYYDPKVDNGEPPEIPGVPHPSMGMESFFDTPVVNGTAFPTLNVDPKSYRFRILNAANDRFFNLQMYVADGSVVSSDNRTNTEVKMVPAKATEGFPELWPTDGRAGGVPDPATAGPNWIQIGTEGGFLPAPAVVPNQPIAWNLDPTTFNFGNVSDHSLLLGPAERADVVVDFSAYAGKTLILYNDAPTAFPALDPRTDYYTGAPDMTDTGGHPGPQVGFGPNTRTVMQIVVAGSTPAPVFDLAKLEAEFASTADKPGVFARSQDPIVVGQTAYNSAYNTIFPTKYPNWGISRIQDNAISFQTVAGAIMSSFPMQPKAIQDEMGEAYEKQYGRMSGNLGVELPFTNSINQNFVLYGYQDPVTEEINDSMTPMSPVLNDGTQLWKITHNGVDTHPVHFHLFDVQLVNRVGWDGAIRMPDANELGWKDTVRVSPLEDTIVALRPVAPKQPFGIPDSIRLLDPTMPQGSTMGFSNLDPLTGQPRIIPVTNEYTNYGWEYMWHCHILSHEEMDMMRPIKFNVARELAGAPALTAFEGAGQIDLAWTDSTVVSNSDITTWGNPANEIGFRVERSFNGEPYTTIGSTLANMVSFTDNTITVGMPYVYRVVAYNAAGDSPSNLVAIGAPFAPTALAAAFSGPPLSVDLSWTDNSANETGFVVERAPVTAGVTGTFVEIGNTGANVTMFSDLSAIQNTTYAYQVFAVNGGTKSLAPAGPITITTPAIPAAPSNMRAIPSPYGTSPIHVDLRWGDNSTNESGFAIERSSDNGATFVEIAQVGPNVVAYADMAVTPDTSYIYRVRAFNMAGYTTYATGTLVTTGSTLPPVAPGNFRVTATGNRNITLGWSDLSNNETGFVIQRSLSAAGPWTTIATTGANVTTFNNNQLARRTTYYYQIRAINDFGMSMWVGPVSGRTR